MLDAGPSVVRMVGSCRFLVRIQSCSHRLFSDRVREDLQPPPIQFHDCSFVLRRRPEHLPDLTGIVAIRREHRGSMCFHDAIQHGFDHAAGDPVIVIRLPRLLDLLEIFRPQLGRVQKIRHIKPQGQLALAPQFIVQIEIVEVLSCTLRAGQSELVCRMNTFS